MDCNNVCNGTATVDDCGVCSYSEDGSSPFHDCNDTCFGSAEINTCGYCVGGTTGKAKHYGQDACGK